MKHWRELNANDLSIAYVNAMSYTGGRGRVLTIMKRLLEQYEYTPTQILEAILRYRDEGRSPWLMEFGDPEFIAEFALEPLEAEAALLEHNGLKPPPARFDYVQNSGDQGVPSVRMDQVAQLAKKQLEEWVNANLERSTRDSGGIVDRILAPARSTGGNRAAGRKP